MNVTILKFLTMPFSGAIYKSRALQKVSKKCANGGKANATSALAGSDAVFVPRGNSHVQWMKECDDYPDHTIDSTGRDLILEIHNQKRVATAKGQYRNGLNDFKIRHAKNMMEMQYDCELEKDAHDIAVKCNEAETPQSSLTTQGENFLKINKTYSEVGNAANAMYIAGTKWFEEITKNGINQNIDFTQYFANKKPTVYHWSQMVWAKTYKIGCEIADCDELMNKEYTIVVCRYSPKGNVVGAKVFQPGQILACEYGTSAGYPALCAYPPFS